MNKSEINNNSFTFVRYIAAINVFLLHISHLTQVPVWIDTLIRSIHGIPIFFTLSGFLIWISLQRESNFKVFFKKRVLRLYPELWGGVTLNAIVIVVLFREKIEWKQFVLFQFAQATFFQQWTPSSLRDYGCGTPNGVLGSISLLLQSYFLLWIFFKILHKKKMPIWIMTIFICVLVACLFPFLQGYIPHVIYRFLEVTAVPSFRMFLLGAFVAEFFDVIIPFLKRFWVVFLVLYIIMKYSFVPDIEITHPVFRTIFLGLATLGFGYAVPGIRIKHDYTYGIFIFHMVIINAFIEIGFNNSFVSVCVSFVLTLILAIISKKTLGDLNIYKKEKS